MQETPPHQTLHLLDLPLEIRLHIYSYLIPRLQILESSKPGFDGLRPTGGRLYSQSFKVLESDSAFRHQIACWRDPRQDATFDTNGKFQSVKRRERFRYATSIFRTCRQISEESLNVLYGDNVFIVRLNNGGEHHLKNRFAQRYRDMIRYLLVFAQHRGVLYGRGSKPDTELWAEILPHVKGLRIAMKGPVRLGYTRFGKSDEEKMREWARWLRPFLRCFKEYLGDRVRVLVDDEGEVVREYFP